MRPRFQLPPLLTQLHHKIEFHDEYERPQRGFFIAELDRREGGEVAAQPILLYVTPANVHGPPKEGPQPPDWVADEATNETHDAERIAAFARRGVSEHWRLRKEGDDVLIECRWGLDTGGEAYSEVRVFRGSDPVVSPTFPDLVLRPADLS